MLNNNKMLYFDQKKAPVFGQYYVFVYNSCFFSLSLKR